MPRLVAALVAAFLFCAGCGSGPRVTPCVVDAEGICAEPHQTMRVRACVDTMVGGRHLTDTGWLVGERWVVDEYGKPVKQYLFVSDRNPDDGKHVEPVARVKRPCAMAGGTQFDVTRSEP